MYIDFDTESYFQNLLNFPPMLSVIAVSDDKTINAALLGIIVHHSQHTFSFKMIYRNLGT